MNNTTLNRPLWFAIVAIVLLIWNALGIFSFFAHTFISDEALAALPAEESALYGAYPFWTTVIFAIAVATGFIGALGLVLKKAWSKKAFIISLLAIIPQMIHNVFFTDAIAVYGTAEAVTMPILVVLLAIFALWFSSYGIKKGWLA
ncbi:hypothetical protein [Winogradskyella rapida]|uniref:Sugar transporter n=1 Tax=Winogradskyella rapida TaxID=549701 RepID=A0ABW3KMP3_9FLAO